MSFLFVLEHYAPYLGGAEKLFRQLTEALAARGHRVTVVTTRFRPDLPKEETLGGVHVHRVNCRNRFLFTLLAFPAALRAARHADVVHTTTYTAAPAAWLAARLRGKRSVITVHEVWGPLWNRLPYLRPWQAWAYRLFERFVLALPFHHYVTVSDFTARELSRVLDLPLPDNHADHLGDGAQVQWECKARLSPRPSEDEPPPPLPHDCGSSRPTEPRTPSPRTPSPVTTSTAKTLPPTPLSPKPLLRIHNGLTYQNFPQSAHHPDPGFHYIYYGRLGVSKGLDLLLPAAAELKTTHPEARLRLVIPRVPAALYRTILAELDALALHDVVDLHHELPYPRLQELILRSSCVVIPSYSEGFCFAAAEAVALGVPVISSGRGALRETVGGRYLEMAGQTSRALAHCLRRGAAGEWDHRPPPRFPLERSVERYLDFYGHSHVRRPTA